MRVAMYYCNRDIRLEELPIPRAGTGELLLKIHSSGICGSDVMEWYRIHKAPLVLGHEIAGEVVEVGEGVKTFSVGDRVTATHHVPCFTCHYCLSGHETVCDMLLSGTHFAPGGFGEYVRLPAINVERGTWKIPAEVSFDEATFVEPLACVLRGLRAAGFKPTQRLLVLGSGISGLLYVALAHALGAGLIVATDLSAYRRDAATRFGADQALDAHQDVSAEFRRLNLGLGADAVVVTTGATSALEQAMDAVERGGTVLFFAPTAQGATVPLSVNNLFWRRDITLTTSYAGSPADCVTALELLRMKRMPIEAMITHRFALADTGEGFKLVEKGDDSIKIIIRPQE
jgi:L-iditol 2-dehydrogenase